MLVRLINPKRIVIGYALLLLFFTKADIYHQHFFDTGLIIWLYNLTRILFIPVLMWLFYYAGHLALARTVKNAIPDSLNYLLLKFFSGVGLWHIFLFLIGLIGWYNRLTLSSLTLIFLIISAPQLNSQLKNLAKIKFKLIPCALIGVPTILFLITKGLYPAGGHDYYNHYFNFYKRVVSTGSILPNDVWYHFFYSKGAGLYFLAMTLTDPLGAQLASCALFFAGVGIIFSILNKNEKPSLLPYIGCALFIVFFIYTPGPIANLAQGGWGDLEKPHEPGAMIMLATLWMVINLYCSNHTKLYGSALLFTLPALVLINPSMSIFAGMFLATSCILFLFAKKIKELCWIIAAVLLLSSALVAIISINYWLTGILDDQILLKSLPLMNLVKVQNWGILFELMVLHWGRSGMLANQVGFDSSFFTKLFSYLRLDIWWTFIPVILYGLLNIIFIKNKRHTFLENTKVSHIAFISCMLLAVITASMVIGRDQPISFYRFTSFNYGPMLCLCLLLIQGIYQNEKNKLIAILTASIIGASVLYLFPIKNHLLHNIEVIKLKDARHILKNGAKFSLGQLSLRDAYQHQQGWPGRMPWGGIYPPMEQVWRMLPKNTKIWSMHIHSYCMLPDCNMQSFMSFRFSTHATDIYFGNENEAKTALKNDHLNYFFFSEDLQLQDILIISPLFTPENIAKHFGIAWTDGHNTLLTWKEKSNHDIDHAWIEKYHNAFLQSSMYKSMPLTDFKKVMAHAVTNHALTCHDLPWCQS